MKLIHRYAYPSPTRTDILPVEDGGDQSAKSKKRLRPPKLHALRDADAAIFYVAKLAPMGFGFTLEINCPAPEELKAARAAAAQERLRKGDVLLLTTRPPLTPEGTHLLAPIPRSNSYVEDCVLAAVRRFLDVCSREEVALSEAMAANLPKGFEDRARLKFQMRAPAFFTHKARRGEPYGDRLRTRRSVGFLLFAREIWENGPDLLCPFGMSGPMNLVWAYLLTVKHPEWLAVPEGDRLVMADIVAAAHDKGQAVFPEAPDTLAFADRWRVELVLDTGAPGPATARRG
ncbi:MAG TPA: hypothetical protein VFA33_28885 [Bryobacteraceae bacterium]|nr:hypothetical protein [Bryobacteraceae bacterium]